MSKNIKDQLIKAIRDSDMSSYELAKLSTVDVSIVSRFRNGLRSIDISTAAKLAEVLNLELREIRSRNAKQ